MEFGHFINFLSMTRIISLQNQNFLPSPHPAPSTTHITSILVTFHSSTSICFALGGGSCSWKQHILWSLSWRQTLQPFQKVLWPCRREGTCHQVQWGILERSVLSFLGTLRDRSIFTLYMLFSILLFYLAICLERPSPKLLQNRLFF